jgi:PmbA protein
VRAPGGGSGSDIEAAARLGVAAAVDAGVSDAEAWCEESVHREIRVYDGAVESLTDAGSHGVGLRVFLDGRSGYAYGTDLSDRGLAGLAQVAAAAASVSDPDEHAGLPETPGAAEVEGLCSPGLVDWDNGRRLELALEVERAARAHAGVSQVDEVVYADAQERVALANSRGFAGGYETTSAYAWASALAGEGADLMTGLGLGLARDPGALDPGAIGDEAADRAIGLAGARQPKGRRCPVLLDSFVAASFVGFIGAMLAADAVQRGRSLFAGREGEEIATEALRLADDGTARDGPASAPFDGEGSPRRRIPLIERGRLETYLFDALTARRAGRPGTASAVRSSYRSPPSVGTSNLTIEPGDRTVDELLLDAGDGLYVTDVAGLHSGVNPISGTFSVGASGRLIEDGELAAPVRELTIASDLVSMLRGVRAVGSEARWVPFGGSVHTAPVLIDEMTVSGA